MGTWGRRMRWRALGVILGAVYMLYWAGRVVFGPLKEPELHEEDRLKAELPNDRLKAELPNGGHGVVKDLSVREWVVLAPLAVVVVVLGVPNVVLASLGPAVRGLQEAALGR